MTYRNLFITFLISGLWHGASWSFIIWGGLHGFYLVFAMLTARVRARLRDMLWISRARRIDGLLQSASVFGLVTIAWIFFRASTLDKAYFIFTRMAQGFRDFVVSLAGGVPAISQPLLLRMPNSYFDLGVIAVALVLLEGIHRMQSKQEIRPWLMRRPVAVRWLSYLFLFWAILLFGVYHNKNEFIYFQF